MSYPHTLRITRPGAGGQQDPETGAWTPPTPLVLYDGAGDVQDMGRTVARDAEGRPTRRSDAVAFLEDESKIGALKVGDTAVVTWADGSTSDAVVARVTRLDGALDLTWL